MLHLAQVCHNPHANNLELQLLAHQKSDGNWVLSNLEFVPIDEEMSQNIQAGMLILANIDENPRIISIENAANWVLELVKQYFPLKYEEEQWRKDLTLQSQDLTRRNLEIETRTEQIQQLEEQLKQEKEALESRREQIQQLEEQLKQQRQELE